MAIINPGDVPINESQVDGTELARRLERLYAVVHSQNSSQTRPPAVTEGGIWSKTVTGGFDLMLFDGTNDVKIGSVINGTASASGILSVDSGNYSILGSDNKIYTPTPAAVDLGAYVEKAGDTMTGALINDVSIKTPLVTVNGDVNGGAKLSATSGDGNVIGAKITSNAPGTGYLFEGVAGGGYDIIGSYIAGENTFSVGSDSKVRNATGYGFKGGFSNFDQNGFQHLTGASNGENVIIQWGYNPAFAQVETPVSFPIAFPSRCISMTMGTCITVFQPFSPTGIKGFDKNGFTLMNLQPPGATTTVWWMAIGV